MTVPKEKLIRMYRTMVRHREFEDRVAKHFAAGEIPGFVHLSHGQEAITAGAIAALGSEDYILTHHRGHGQLVAKGGNVDAMMAELFGKRTGIMKGKGGSMHLTDPEVGDLGADGIVAEGLVTACGAGLSAKMRKSGQVTLCFFGDGCLNTARFHEGLNLAAIWKLPIVYICENNGYAEETAITYSMSSKEATIRAAAYDVPAVSVDGNDVMAVYEAVGEAIELARRGGGPSFVECKTCRWRGHFEGDAQTYRAKQELEECKKRDPIKRFREKLIQLGIFSQTDADRIGSDAVGEMDKAVEFARQSPWPGPEEVLTDVWAPPSVSIQKETAPSGRTREIGFLTAINEAVDEELGRDPSAFLLGEDIQTWGASLGEFKGLYQKYGERVRNTPISETAILGTAIGSAATGMRPIAFLMFSEFMGVCMAEIMNALCKSRYMTGGKVKMPVTLMAYSGAGMSAAGEHSACLDGLFASISGLKLVVPSTPYDAKGLLKSAIREDNPVVFFYHKMLLVGPYKSQVPVEDFTIPLGKADVKRQGKDVTVVATALMVHRALAAAEILAAKGVSVEVIDPRTLVPLDKETIINSVRKTGRLVIMHEEPKTGGFAADIAAAVGEEGFGLLKAPIKRVCAPDTPIPFSPALEKIWLPGEENLIKAINEVM